MVQFDGDTLLLEVLQTAPEAVPVFMSAGMHCLGCIAASGENIEQACAVHGIDVDQFLATLNNYLAANAKA